MNGGPSRARADLGTQMTWGDSRELRANGTQLANLDIFMELLVGGDGAQLKLPANPTPRPVVRRPQHSQPLGGPTLTGHPDSSARRASAGSAISHGLGEGAQRTCQGHPQGWQQAESPTCASARGLPMAQVSGVAGTVPSSATRDLGTFANFPNLSWPHLGTWIDPEYWG